MKVNVTQEDIDKGIKGDSCKCPIALAVCRMMDIDPDDNIVEVEDECITLNVTDSIIYWGLDDIGIAFVDYFDNGTPVHPVEFEAYAVVRVAK